MRPALFAAIGLAAAGCLSTGTLPAANKNDVALYGPVPIIRPGMRLSEVDRATDSTHGMAGTLGSMTCFYPDGLLIYESSYRVASCKCATRRSTGPGSNPPLEDAYLELKLKAGMSARQVEAILGSPKYGVETPAGSVELVYPDREIAVEYVDGALVRWRKTVVYNDREGGD
jgi:hypothetical protein